MRDEVTILALLNNNLQIHNMNVVLRRPFFKRIVAAQKEKRLCGEIFSRLGGFSPYRAWLTRTAKTTYRVSL